MKAFSPELELGIIQRDYPNLKLRQVFLDNKYIIEGHIGFSTKILDEIIEDQYEIKLSIPKNYPKEMIQAYEIGHRIKRVDENHINGDGTLCVGRPVEILQKLAPNYYLCDYIDKILIGYLAQYSYKEKFGFWPYGESAHGTTGIIDYYKDKYGLNNLASILDFLKALQESISRRQKGYERCWCGCGKLFKNCRKQRQILENWQKGHNYADDTKAIENVFQNKQN